MDFALCLVYLASLGVVAHILGEKLPREEIDPEAFPYRAFGFEKGGRIYERLGIRRWKDRVPDMSRIMRDMIPKRIEGKADSESLRALVAETCIAEKVHLWLMALGLGCLAICKGIGGRIITALNIIGNLPFIIIQRYNRPRLKKALTKLELKEARSKPEA